MQSRRLSRRKVIKSMHLQNILISLIKRLLYLKKKKKTRKITSKSGTTENKRQNGRHSVDINMKTQSSKTFSKNLNNSFGTFYLLKCNFLYILPTDTKMRKKSEIRTRQLVARKREKHKKIYYAHTFFRSFLFGAQRKFAWRPPLFLNYENSLRNKKAITE